MSLELIHKFKSNPITPFKDAMQHYAAVGSGVYKFGAVYERKNHGLIIRTTSDMELFIENGKLNITRGFGSALGYQFMNVDTTVLDMPSTGSFYVGVTLIVVDEETIQSAHDDNKYNYDIDRQSILDEYDMSAKTQTDINKRDSALDSALIAYEQAEAKLANNTIDFKVSTDSDGTVKNIENNILVLGYGKAFIPLWYVSGGTVTTLNEIEPGIASNAQNLLSGGYINGVSFDTIFTDFINDTPGVNYTDEADHCDITYHIGANDSAHQVDSDLKIGNSGYLPMICKLVDEKAIDTSNNGTTNISFTFPSPSVFIPNKIIAVGKTGTILGEWSKTVVANNGSFYLDSNLMDDGVVLFEFNSDYTSGAVVSIQGEIDSLFNPTEYEVISIYVEGTKVEL